MDGGWSELYQRLAMLARSVALVLGEAIARKVRVERYHQAISVDLGHDAGSGDTQTVNVCLWQRVLGQSHPWEKQVIQQKCIYPSIESRYGASKRLSRGWDNAQRIHLGWGSPSHADRFRDLQDYGQQALSLFGTQLFGVTHTGQQTQQVGVVEREHRRRCADRSGPRTPSCFIQASDARVTGAMEFVFFR